ncbi:MAG: lysylphosphatidylglycerol synthase transmembrane domain-containing protein [Candidatus Bathyarchaeia archaeon]|nr:flippase-like domain-containing protein [Candidatus Bathyarchaeota archaeon]
MKVNSSIRLVAFIIFGLLVFIIYLFLFIGFGDIIEVFRSVNPYEYAIYYSITIIAMVLSMLFYTMSWNNLMEALSINIGLKRAFLYCWLGNFVDLIVPLEAVSGEITKIYLVNKEVKGSSGKIVASVVIHRIITTFITLSTLLLASVFFVLKYEVKAEILYLLLLMIVGSLLLIASLLYLSIKEEATEKLIELPIKAVSFVMRKRLNLSDIKERARQSLIQYHSGFKIFGRNWGALMKSITYSFISWLLHLNTYFLVFYALGFNEISAKIYETVIVYSISMATQTIPIALPLGLVEIVMTSLYTLFNIPIAISGTATLLIRVVTFWLQILIGYVIAQWMGVKNLLSRDAKETLT